MWFVHTLWDTLVRKCLIKTFKDFRDLSNIGVHIIFPLIIVQMGPKLAPHSFIAKTLTISYWFWKEKALFQIAYWTPVATDNLTGYLFSLSNISRLVFNLHTFPAWFLHSIWRKLCGIDTNMDKNDKLWLTCNIIKKHKLAKYS